MVGNPRSGKYIKFGIYLVAVVLINLAGLTLFFRLDATANKVYSVSEASREVVSTLSEPLTINVFFTKNLPAPHNNTERYLQDLLEEYSIYANRYFNYRFYDVSAEEGDISPEARANQELAKNYGINPIQIQVIEDDKVKFQNAYMGLVIIHGDQLERIPTITSTERLEYQLTTAIMKLNNKISALLALEDKIKITLFLSSSLEAVAPLIGLEGLPGIPDRMETIVKDLNTRSFNKLEYRYLDPSRSEAAAAAATALGDRVLSLQWPAVPQQNIAAGSGFIGLVLQHDDRVGSIRLLNILRLPLIGTRYELADMNDMETVISENIESLIDINEDIGYLTDRGTPPLFAPPQMAPNQPPPEALNNFRALLGQNYAIKDVNLEDGRIPQSLKTLIVVSPKERLSDYDLFLIDQYLMRGGNLAVFLDSFNEIFPPAQMGRQQGPTYTPLNTGMEKLLEHYGVRLKQAYVLDENCYRQQVPSQLGGGERPIYFAPLIDDKNINNELDFMRNIKRLVAVKVSPLELESDRIKQQDLKTYRLLASSEKSWEMRGRINLNPMFINPPANKDDMQSYPLAYLLEGSFNSYFDGKPLPAKPMENEQETDTEAEGDATGEADTAESAADKAENKPRPALETTGQFVARGDPAKIFILSSSEMVKDTVLDEEGNTANAIFLLNLLDGLNGREDIAVMRAKRQIFNPLAETGAGTKTLAKTLNIVGLPVLVVFFGVLFWFHRVSRKKKIQSLFTSKEGQ
jgi:ABC-type uncharacterized transport system involved in gliding motility auxiliary subunit